MTKRTIGIYGGSFNPIHNGHTQLGLALCQKGLVDELWFVVSPHNPHKQQHDLLADEARLALARIAVEETHCLRVSDVEFSLPRPSYMVNTLETLRNQYPHCEFVLVIGADNWERFTLWYRHEEILRRHRLIIYPRPGYELQDIPPGVTVADTPLIPISSTQIRDSIHQGDYNGEGLHPSVWKEINIKGYYR
ncbi:MAG: nicotinate-nucleotide adenylyltransferase [Bacteroidaceae bacterium]|nr:nicotinate-nucleotide adenylyltransferase [Bacteroidaceae bacterium]